MPLKTDGEVAIGRDPECSLAIDSLAVAPRHALLNRSGDQWVITRVDPEYLLFVNEGEMDRHVLQHGDRIRVGKHLIYYTEDEDAVIDFAPAPEPEEEGDTKPWNTVEYHLEANLQVLRGEHIGLVIPLRRPLTRLGKDDSALAMIARRKEGYFLSSLSGANSITVNDEFIDDRSVKLDDQDIIRVNDNILQFFSRTSIKAEDGSVI
jgi:predicted component of type VI protein secretion system